MKFNCVAIDVDDYKYHSYYIITFYFSPYTLQEELSIDGKVISSSEIVCEGTSFFQSVSILFIMFYKNINPITQLYF